MVLTEAVVAGDPATVRLNGALSASATIQFSIADAEAFQSLGIWEGIMQHEMINNIGYGMASENQGPPSVAGGDNALLIHDVPNGAAVVAGVPVDGDGGAAARNSDEDMAGDGEGTDYCSDATIAFVEEFGFGATWSESDYLFAQA